MATPPELVVRCIGCGRNIRYPAKLMGKLASCPGCKTQVSLPDSEATAELSTSNTKSEPQLAARISREAAKHRSLGRYHLIKRLGSGGFGEVWEATDTRLSRQVAVKLPLFHASDAKRIKRFLTEGRAAAQLRHPNIVGVLDAGEVDGQYFLAIEFVSGHPLNEFAANQKLSHHEAARLISLCAKALHYAHNNRILHRDIKPANIVLNELHEPKILDFGLARLEDEEGRMTLDGTVLGTPAYMAPEQARGDLSSIGSHSDQYSLGATLYWLLTGKALFEGPNAIVLAQVVSSVPVEPQSLTENLSPSLNAICLKSISKSPNERYRDCLEFAQDLDRFLNNEAILAKPDSYPKQMLRWFNRNPIDVLLGSSLLAILLISLTVSIAGWIQAYRNAGISVELEGKKQLQLDELEKTRRKLNEEVESLDQLTLVATNAEAKAKSLEEESKRVQVELQFAIQKNQTIEQEAKRNQLEAEANQSQIDLVFGEADSLKRTASKRDDDNQSQLRERTVRELLIEKYSQVFDQARRENWPEASKQLAMIDTEHRSEFHSAYLSRLIQFQGKMKVVAAKYPNKSLPVSVDEFDQTLSFRTKQANSTFTWFALDNGLPLAKVTGNETQAIYDRTTNTLVCARNGRAKNAAGSTIRMGKGGGSLISFDLPVYVEFIYFNALGEPMAVCRSLETPHALQIPYLDGESPLESITDRLLMIQLTPRPVVAWDLAKEPLFEANFDPSRASPIENRPASRIAISFSTRNHPRWLNVKYIDRRLEGQMNLEFLDACIPQTVKLVMPTLEKWDTLTQDPPFQNADVRDSVWYSEGIPLLLLKSDDIPDNFLPTHQYITNQYVILMDKQQFVSVQYAVRDPFEK